MEVELKGVKYELREPLYGEYKEYKNKILELGEEIKNKNISAIKELDEFMEKYLFLLSDFKITSDILNKCKGKEVEKVLLKLNNFIMEIEEESKKKLEIS